MILKNKGMFLEEVINFTINKLLKENKVVIYKTSISNQIIKVNQNKKFYGVLKENHFCDYIGIYNGFYVEFDAKETEQDFFNLNNIKQKQINKIQLIIKNGGIGFFLVFFHKYHEYFILEYKQIKNFLTKKIPYQFFIDECYKINDYGLFIDLIGTFNHLINHK